METFQGDLVRTFVPESLAAKDGRLQSDLFIADGALGAMGSALSAGDRIAIQSGYNVLRQALCRADSGATDIAKGNEVRWTRPATHCQPALQDDQRRTHLELGQDIAQLTRRYRQTTKSWLCVFAAVTFAASACGSSVATSTPSLATASPSPSEIQQATLTIDGQVRSYTVFHPSSLDPSPLFPLVIAIHGYTVDAAWMEATTGFDDQATKSGFVVVYPDGVFQSWNAGSCCGDAPLQNVDDVAFVRQLIDRMVSTGHIDPKRVFVTGVSNGGMMAHRLACELSDQITAIASVSGALATNACKPTHPISVLEMHSTGDATVPYAGAFSVPLRLSFPSTLSVMRHWAALDGCTAVPTVTQSAFSTTSTWRGCREGTVIVLDAVNGAVHGWFGCNPCQPGEPDSTSLVWDFFSHVPARA